MAMALAMVVTFMVPAEARFTYDAATGDITCTGGCSMTVYPDGGVVFVDSNGDTLEVTSDGTVYFNGF
jgi:hypothetical protein